MHDVQLSYITTRGPWYHVSWKGISEKSGGIATNIGIHLFDLLLWLFGEAGGLRVHHSDPQHMAGFLELARMQARGARIYAEPWAQKDNREPVFVERAGIPVDPHVANFLECVRTRQRPNSDIEKCVRSSATCLLGNASYRSKLRLDWDEAKMEVAQKEANRYLIREYRKPWKLEV